MRLSQEEKLTSNPNLHKKLYREVQRDIRCTICPPNGGENAGRVPRHKVKKAYELNHKRRHR